jgi:serine/threonine protein kinase
MAPEIICKYTYTKAIDVWSTSVIMFILFNGKHPIWNNKMTTDEYSALMAKKVELPPLKGATKLAQDFYSKISKFDPHERYSVQEGLKHPWITRNFQDEIPLAVH